MNVFKLSATPQVWGVLLVVAAVAALSVSKYVRQGNTKNTKKAVITSAIVGMVILVILFSLFQNKVTVSDNGLKVTVPPFIMNRVIDKSEISKAYVVDLTKDTSVTPVSRKNGIGIGSFRTGFFGLANGEDAIVMLSSDQAVYVQLKDQSLLLSPDDLDGFVQALERSGVTVGE